jgi:ABC-type glutathione transport system ATPase component
MLFQHPEAVLNGGMTVSAILSESLEKDGELSRAEIRERVLQTLEWVHLDSAYARRHPANLSAGEKQRVALARALVNNPPLLLADEPTAGLDNENVIGVLSLLRSAADNGAGVLLVTHEIEAAEYADEVYTMDSGKLSREA